MIDAGLVPREEHIFGHAQLQRAQQQRRAADVPVAGLGLAVAPASEVHGRSELRDRLLSDASDCPSRRGRAQLSGDAACAGSVRDAIEPGVGRPCGGAVVGHLLEIFLHEIDLEQGHALREAVVQQPTIRRLRCVRAWHREVVAVGVREAHGGVGVVQVSVASERGGTEVDRVQHQPSPKQTWQRRQSLRKQRVVTFAVAVVLGFEGARARHYPLHRLVALHVPPVSARAQMVVMVVILVVVATDNTVTSRRAASTWRECRPHGRTRTAL